MDAPSTRRILIVDNDHDAAAQIALLIEVSWPSAWVRTAFDGEVGLQVACAWRPDVVITDIDMSLLSGIEAALEMRVRLTGHPLRIIAMTGHDGWRTDHMALAVFNQILIKPLDLEAIRLMA